MPFKRARESGAFAGPPCATPLSPLANSPWLDYWRLTGHNQAYLVLGRCLDMQYKLYGMPGSLYTGKVRSYLIKQGIDFDNRAVGEPRFRAEILSQIGRWIIPVVEALLVETGLSPLLSLKTSRRVERHNHLEVWGPVIGA
jgi:hypothetical protein